MSDDHVTEPRANQLLPTPPTSQQRQRYNYRYKTTDGMLSLSNRVSATPLATLLQETPSRQSEKADKSVDITQSWSETTKEFAPKKLPLLNEARSVPETLTSYRFFVDVARHGNVNISPDKHKPFHDFPFVGFRFKEVVVDPLNVKQRHAESRSKLKPAELLVKSYGHWTRVCYGVYGIASHDKSDTGKSFDYAKPAIHFTTVSHAVPQRIADRFSRWSASTGDVLNLRFPHVKVHESVATGSKDDKLLQGVLVSDENDNEVSLMIRQLSETKIQKVRTTVFLGDRSLYGTTPTRFDAGSSSSVVLRSNPTEPTAPKWYLVCGRLKETPETLLIDCDVAVEMCQAAKVIEKSQNWPDLVELAPMKPINWTAVSPLNDKKSDALSDESIAHAIYRGLNCESMVNLEGIQDDVQSDAGAYSDCEHSKCHDLAAHKKVSEWFTGKLEAANADSRLATDDAELLRQVLKSAQTRFATLKSRKVVSHVSVLRWTTKLFYLVKKHSPTDEHKHEYCCWRFNLKGDTEYQMYAKLLCDPVTFRDATNIALPVAPGTQDVIALDMYHPSYDELTKQPQRKPFPIPKLTCPALIGGPSISSSVFVAHHPLLCETSGKKSSEGKQPNDGSHWSCCRPSHMQVGARRWNGIHMSIRSLAMKLNPKISPTSESEPQREDWCKADDDRARGVLVIAGNLSKVAQLYSDFGVQFNQQHFTKKKKGNAESGSGLNGAGDVEDVELIKELAVRADSQLSVQAMQRLDQAGINAPGGKEDIVSSCVNNYFNSKKVASLYIKVNKASFQRDTLGKLLQDALQWCERFGSVESTIRTSLVAVVDGIHGSSDFKFSVSDADCVNCWTRWILQFYQDHYNQREALKELVLTVLRNVAAWDRNVSANEKTCDWLVIHETGDIDLKQIINQYKGAPACARHRIA